MKVIITGSEGFIGSRLAAAFRKRGIEVVGIDRLNGTEAGEYFTTADLSDVSCVYHLAAQTSVFNVNKTDIIRDNIEVFKTVCDACARYGVKLVYASSSTAADGNTTSIYGMSKRFDEEYARCYNPSATGVRFHNVYGPQPRQGTLLWYMLHDRTVRLYNNGCNMRHFTYIDDILQALEYASGCGFKLVNAANPECVTTLKVAEEVRRYKPLEIELVAETRRFDNVAQRVNEAVFTVPLQYTPLSEGIRRIFDMTDAKKG